MPRNKYATYTEFSNKEDMLILLILKKKKTLSVYADTGYFIESKHLFSPINCLSMYDLDDEMR